MNNHEFLFSILEQEMENRIPLSTSKNIMNGCITLP